MGKLERALGKDPELCGKLLGNKFVLHDVILRCRRIFNAKRISVQCVCKRVFVSPDVPLKANLNTEIL